ncbi:PAS domain S-box protein [Trichocoleus sp. ST-U3]
MTHSPTGQEVQALLKHSEERFSALVANIPGAVYHCAYDEALQRSPLRTMAFFSEAIEEISGYSPSDFINNRVRSFTSIIHPQDRPRVEQAVRQGMQAKQPYVIEYRIVRADGSLVWVYDKGKGIFSEKGEGEPQELPLQIDGVILDISDRKQAEADLQRTQVFLNSVVENLPVGVFIKDAVDLRFMYWNKASEDVFGYSQEDVLGKNDYDFLPHEQARYLRAKDRQVLTGGKLVESRDTPLMTPHHGERRIHTKKIPLLDDSGTPRYLLGICEDITESKKAEEGLRESENHYRRILETASEGIWMFDVDSKTTFANSRIAEMLGYTVEEMLGRSLFDFMDEESRMLAQAYVERRRRGIHERHDFKFRRKDGSDLWAIVSATPILDAAGEFVGVLRMITDISDRKQVEQALQASHQQFVHILERITDAFFALDHQWQFTYLNGEAERIFERNREELRGVNIWEALPEMADTIVEQQYHKAKLEQIPVIFETFCSQWNSWFEVRVYPCAEGLSVFWRDISDRKQAEKALQDSEQRFRATFNQAAVGIAHANLKGEFLRINQKYCDLLGYTQEEMLTRTFQDITHPDDEDADCSQITQLLAGKIQMYSMEKRYIARSGAFIWVNLTVSLRRSSLGIPKYFIAVVQDISNKKQAEEALRRSESELRTKNQQLQQTLHQLKQTQAQLIQNEKMIGLGQMVAGIAHEINNPISFIYGNIAYAREYASDLLHLVQLYAKHYPEAVPEIQQQITAFDLEFIKADFPKLLESMKKGAKRIRSIVLSLRNFSHLDEADMKKVDIHEGISSTLLILQHRLKKHPASPEIKVIQEYGQLPLVECYPSQLNQVLMNLLNNAIDALETQPCSPMIAIRTEVKYESGVIHPSHVVIRVSDNGCGIPEEVKQRIFDPFFTTKPVGVGTGLGLSIAHSIIVEKHGGQLTCSSTPGQGTEFAIELPIQQKLYLQPPS